MRIFLPKLVDANKYYKNNIFICRLEQKPLKPGDNDKDRRWKTSQNGWLIKENWNTSLKGIVEQRQSYKHISMFHCILIPITTSNQFVERTGKITIYWNMSTLSQSNNNNYRIYRPTRILIDCFCNRPIFFQTLSTLFHSLSYGLVVIFFNKKNIGLFISRKNCSWLKHSFSCFIVKMATRSFAIHMMCAREPVANNMKILI